MKPIVLKIPVEPDPKEIRKYMGEKKGVTEVSPKIEKIIEEMIKLGKDITVPQGAYSIMKIVKKEEDNIELEKFSLPGKRISQVLRNSIYVVLLTTTIGPKLEEKIEELESKGKFTEALVLDAVGSTTSDQAMDFLHANIKSEFHRKGFSLTMRFSPGYGDLPLTVQKDLVYYAGGEEIGIKVTPSYMMIPRKSVSAIIGLNR